MTVAYFEFHGMDILDQEQDFFREVLEVYKTLPCLWDESVKATQEEIKNGEQKIMKKINKWFPSVKLRAWRAQMKLMTKNYKEELVKVLKAEEEDKVYESQLWYFYDFDFLEKTTIKEINGNKYQTTTRKRRKLQDCDDVEESYMCRKKMNWSHDEILKLIHEVTKYPFLRLNSANVVDSSIRYKAYKKIARTLGVSVDDMKRKLRHLQISYTTVKRERVKENQVVTTWPYYELLHAFNSAVCSPEEIMTCIENNFSVNSKDASVNTEAMLMESLNTGLEILEEPLDEFDVFGEFVAAEIRNLPTEAQRRRLKRLIFQDWLDITESLDTY